MAVSLITSCKSFESLGGKLIDGAVNSINSQDNQDKIDEFLLGLDESFADLDVDTIGENLIQGLLDKVNDPATEASMSTLLDSIVADLNINLKALGDDFINNLSTEEKSKKLNELLTNTLNKKIDLSSLGESFRESILGSKTKDALSKTLPQLDGISNGIQSIGTGINDFNKRADGINGNIQDFNKEIDSFTMVVNKLATSVNDLEKGWKNDWMYILLGIVAGSIFVAYIASLFLKKHVNALVEAIRDNNPSL